MNLPDSIVDFLADKLKTNIRQLEGAITKINALTLVTGSTPTLNMAQQVVRDIQSNHEPIPLTVEKIIAEVWGLVTKHISTVCSSSALAPAHLL